MLASDGNRENDPDPCLKVFHVGVVGLDIASLSGLSDTVDTGVGVTPVVTVYNSGSVPVDFLSILHIASDYGRQESTFDLAPGDSANVSYLPWIPEHRGSWPVCCSLVSGAFVRANNESVFVRVLDAGVRAVIWPRGAFVPWGPNVPRALIHNYGNTADQEVPVTFSVYDSSHLIYQSIRFSGTVAPGDSGIVSFQPWSASLGRYRAQVMVNLDGDKHQTNDTLSNWFWVVNGTIDLALSDLYPAETIASGTVLPRVKLDNQGTVTTDVSCLLSIFKAENVQVYRSDTAPAIIEPGQAVQLTFGPSWSATPGPYLARAVVFNYAKTVQDTLSGYFTVVTGGVEERSSVIAPNAFALDVPSPNPSREAVTIRYALPKTSQLSLRVYNATGQVVRILVDSRQKSGCYSVSWNREDDRGGKLSAGIYLIRLNSPSFVRTRKIVITQ